RPGGIWYTPTTGIWQTAWLEPVPQSYIRSLHIVPDVDANAVTVRVEVAGPAANMTVRVEAIVRSTGPATPATGRPGEDVRLNLPPEVVRPTLWTPDSPTLFPMFVYLQGDPGGRGTVDLVHSYFGLRKTPLGKDEKGVPRLFLNNK